MERRAAETQGVAAARPWIADLDVAITGRSAAALLLFATLVLLALLFPRLPDRYGGGLWRYFAGYTAVLLLLGDVSRNARSIRGWWAASPRRRRTAFAMLGVGATLVGTLALREWAPGVFGILSRESGLWEPLSLLCYWGGALLIYRTLPAAEGSASDRRPWLTVAAAYGLLGLEEIDYFGIFGSVIGRIDGVYAGSLHDLIRLVTEGVLSPVGLGVLIALLAVAGIGLWRTGWIEPPFIVRLARGGEIGWLAAGFAFLWIAAAEEAHFFGWVAQQPTPEEAVELVGALCLGVYALELAARRMDHRAHTVRVSVWRGASPWRSTLARGGPGRRSPTSVHHDRSAAVRQGDRKSVV